MKPIGKYIVIKTIKEELKTESGLLLSAQDVDGFRYRKGIVVKQGTNVADIKAVSYTHLTLPTNREV